MEDTEYFMNLEREASRLRDEIRQERDHSADLARQLRIVREWMARHSHSGSQSVCAAVETLSCALLWSDDAEQPEQTITASEPCGDVIVRARPGHPQQRIWKVHEDDDMADAIRGIAPQPVEEAVRHTVSPGAIAVTASLFERVADLEQELVKLGDKLHMLDGDLNRQIQSLTEALRDVADIHPEGL